MKTQSELRTTLLTAIREARQNGLTDDETLAAGRSLFPPPPVFKADVLEQVGPDEFGPTRFDTLVTGLSPELALRELLEVLRQEGCLASPGEAYLVRLACYSMPPNGVGQFLSEEWFAVRNNHGKIQTARAPKPSVMGG